MTCSLPRYGLSLFLLLCFSWTLTPADPANPTPPVPEQPDLSEYKSVETAVTTRISKASTATVGQSGYLGVHITANGGKLFVGGVAADSPAAKAGLQLGDLVVSVGGTAVASADVFRELLQARAPGETVKLAVMRQSKPLEMTATLAAISRPMTPNTQRVTLGVIVAEGDDGEGAPVRQVAADSPASAAGVKMGDLLVKVDGAAVTSTAKLGDILSEKKAGDTVILVVRRDGKDVELKAQLTAERGPGGPGGRGKDGGWDNRALSYFRKDVYRLAVVCIEYPDAKHNDKVTSKDWEEALFSRSTYVKKNSPTGQAVHGSMNDYYQELSYGKLRVEGKAFPWIEVGKKRGDYAQGTGTGAASKSALLTEAVDKLLARDGKEALKGFDGIFFCYAGDRVRTTRGGLYWPHRASFRHQGKTWPYFIVNEGGSRMSNISVICHEFGHMLGLPDLYARPENPGSEGVGVWCAMSNQNGNGRPQHFSAWCKEQLGWAQPAVIDPTVKQKLLLAPIEDSPKECFKVLVKPDGSEYFLLENRRKKGFDQDLPAEGLLVWRVVGNRPILEESHGVEGPSGPRMFPTAVPYPSGANTAFTPYTTPSSRSQLGGGLPVHITNIRKLADGRITFHIGFEYQ